MIDVIIQAVAKYGVSRFMGSPTDITVTIALALALILSLLYNIKKFWRKAKARELHKYNMEQQVSLREIYDMLIIIKDAVDDLKKDHTDMPNGIKPKVHKNDESLQRVISKLESLCDSKTNNAEFLKFFRSMFEAMKNNRTVDF